MTTTAHAMNLRAIVAAACLLLLGSGCSLSEDDLEVRIVPVEEVDVVAHSGRTVQFSVMGNWHNSCGEFSHVEARLTGTTYSITLFGQQPEGALCFAAPTPISGEWETRVPTEDTYTFAFEREGRPSLDTTLVMTTRSMDGGGFVGADVRSSPVPFRGPQASTYGYSPGTDRIARALGFEEMRGDRTEVMGGLLVIWTMRANSAVLREPRSLTGRGYTGHTEDGSCV